jgi:hypothetical protein
MQKAHDSQYNDYWQNLPNVDTPIVAAQLNRNEQTVDTMDDRIIVLDTTKASQTDMLQAVKDITFDDDTGDFTITFFNGLTATIHTDLEKTAINFDYDDDPTSPHYESLVLTLVDGTVKYIDMSALITEYDFASSSTIAFTNTSGTITADILNGSVTDQKLQPSYLADITVQATRSETASANAQTYKFDAEAWSSGTRNGVPVPASDPAYHNNSRYWSQQANVTSLVSLTDVGIDDPQEGNALMYDSVTGTWVNKNVNLDEVGQLAIVGPASGQVLKYNGVNWANADDEGGLLPKVTVYGTEAGYRLGKGGQFIVMTSLGSETFVANVPDYGQWDIYDGTAATVYESVEVDTVKEYSVDLRQQIPEGSTAVPTDVIQTWLNCAGIFDKNYTTIAQVLSDSTTLSALIASNNAADYMARSTTWASDVVADSTAMSYIGLNNYCSDALLAVADWVTAICNSTYFESVINVKVPTMTSNTTPSGVASASTIYGSGYEAYRAFDNDASTFWSAAASDANKWVKYYFGKVVKICMARIKPVYSGGNSWLHDYKIQGTLNDSDWSDSDMYSDSLSNVSTDKTVTFPMKSGEYFRLSAISSYTGNVHIDTLQFYGREDV